MSLQRILNTIASGWVQAKQEGFQNHPLAILIREDFRESVENIVNANNETYLVKASPGAGNWADVPWLSILDPNITTTTQSGIYPVYLFRADGTGVYLSLGFGTTELRNEHGTAVARSMALELREETRSQYTELDSWNKEIVLRSGTQLGQSYEWASAGAKFYPTENIPDDETLIDDLSKLLQIYSKISLNSTSPDAIGDLQMTHLSKPFLLLAGISGTGKSRFVREQARVTGSIEETYCLTSVRPDWHEPSDLLGYVSRLSKDNEAHYVVTDVLKFFAKAWRAIVDAKFIIETESLGGHGDCLVVKGRLDELNRLAPYWLCLDEMNLAPVEQYFADYLSVIETRNWLWEDDTFTYACDPLLKPDTIKQIADTTGLRRSLGFEDSQYDAVWELICKHGLSVPFNLIVAGTVNMDETTHGFSRKVIDRALSFDFGEFFPNNIDDFFTATKEPKPLTFPTHSNATLEMFEDVEADKDAGKTKAFFVAVNEVLKGSPFELAFRAFNELCLAVVSFAPKDDIELAAVFDDFLMCKVLPRIEGDEDRLSGQAGKNLLEMLSAVLESQLSDIWEATRPDLLQQALGLNESAVAVECRSKKKLEWMNHQLSHGFTSFWP